MVRRMKDEVIREMEVALREMEAELQHLRNARKKSDGTAPGIGKQLVAAKTVIMSCMHVDGVVHAPY